MEVKSMGGEAIAKAMADVLPVGSQKPDKGDRVEVISGSKHIADLIGKRGTAIRRMMDCLKVRFDDGTTTNIADHQLKRLLPEEEQ